MKGNKHSASKTEKKQEPSKYWNESIPSRTPKIPRKLIEKNHLYIDPYTPNETIMDGKQKPTQILFYSTECQSNHTFGINLNALGLVWFRFEMECLPFSLATKMAENAKCSPLPICHLKWNLFSISYGNQCGP